MNPVPNLRRADLAAPRDSLGKGGPSRNPVPNLAPCGFGCSDLLWNFTMAEDPKLTLLGNKKHALLTKHSEKQCFLKKAK